MAKYIKNSKTNKAAGCDNLKPTFLQKGGESLFSSLCCMFNQSVKSSSFPASLKMADISPLFKKKDPLCKNNYRPVNVLTVISKLFERILSDQLTAYFIHILNCSLSAYKKGYSCQHVILQMTEYWRNCLDNGDTVSTVAMDLSKAFDCMPHGLLVAKLFAYGLSINACNLVINYLCDRRQRVKVRGGFSELSIINRGVPQGSVLGPLLFNIFMNDIFYSDIGSNIYNYADDNHLCTHNKCVSSVITLIESDSEKAISWFNDNDMDANADKFQFLAMDRNGLVPSSISVQGHTIPSCDNINVLGITLDSKLKFNEHISKICTKASRQINALKRISKHLNEESRLQIFKTFIASNFTYCPITWMFCGKKNSRKLEKIQERALRFVYNDKISPYIDLLRRGNFLSLSALRIRFLAIEMYKCTNSLAPSYLCDLFKPRAVKYNFRDPFRLIQPEFNTIRFGYKFFTYY